MSRVARRKLPGWAQARGLPVAAASAAGKSWELREGSVWKKV
eukprot:CAMPEP_0178458830 /NCGR_PEP_ID=MMETSP0689_2-20121128/47759_1 /TAXON_ID=160604 /ORGANISM="Amphidinium massartii, Strain CS-259" /LENGTH=41 /DNA_ID= /DNA_START= /DNA_END= /DNA_ORIENTATION=